MSRSDTSLCAFAQTVSFVRSGSGSVGRAGEVGLVNTGEPTDGYVPGLRLVGQAPIVGFSYRVFLIEAELSTSAKLFSPGTQKRAGRRFGSAAGPLSRSLLPVYCSGIETSHLAPQVGQMIRYSP